MKKPGIVIELGERKFIVYNNQPLLIKTGKVVLNLIDDKFNLLTDENGKPKTVLKNTKDYVEELKKAKVIGMVD